MTCLATTQPTHHGILQRNLADSLLPQHQLNTRLCVTGLVLFERLPSKILKSSNACLVVKSTKARQSFLIYQPATTCYYPAILSLSIYIHTRDERLGVGCCSSASVPQNGSHHLCLRFPPA